MGWPQGCRLLRFGRGKGYEAPKAEGLPFMSFGSLDGVDFDRTVEVDDGGRGRRAGTGFALSDGCEAAEAALAGGLLARSCASKFFIISEMEGTSMKGGSPLAALLLLPALAKRGEVAAAKRAFVAVETEQYGIELAVLKERAGEDGVGRVGGGAGIDDGEHELHRWKSPSRANLTRPITAGGSAFCRTCSA